MVENLLHADVVLSQHQVKRLMNAGVKGLTGTPDEHKIGVITFLGTDNMQGKTVHLLMRFEDGQYGTPDTPFALKLTFGEDFSVMYGNAVCTTGSMWRVLATCKLEKRLENPEGFIHAKARRYAEMITRMLIWDSKMPDYDYEAAYADDQANDRWLESQGLM